MDNNKKTIKFGKYEFSGPYPSGAYLYDKSGVFIILCKDYREDERYYIVDVDESDSIRSAIETHNRKVCWTKNCYGVGTLAVAVFYTDDKEFKKKLVSYIRELYDVPCG